MNRGAFDQTITVQRSTSTRDTHGEPVLTWADLQKARARVRYGTAQEKREAAQQTGEQAATFEVVPTATLLSTTLKDRIQFNGSAWNINDIAPLDRHTLRFTAIRAR